MDNISLARRALTTTLAPALLATLAACGGDGSSSSSGGTPTATVTSVSIAATRYGQPAMVTINGTGLDSSLAVSSDQCNTMTLLTSAPNASSSTTAYYSCNVHGGISGTVTAKSNGTTVGSGTFTVPEPVVTLAVSNGQGVNGNIVLSLRADVAPATVDNFLDYVNANFYTNTIFHRVVAGFIMQAGGYSAPVSNLSTASTKTTIFPGIPVEQTGLSNVAGTVAMANDGTTDGTNSQFFFNLASNTGLDGGYAVFGTITAGSDVVSAILAAPSTCAANNAAQTIDCLPIPNVVISTATQTQ